MFSIIIIGYNAEKTIKRALDSITKNKYSNSIEIVYVDDGSSDGTREIIDNYSLKYPIKKIYLSENTGTFNARCQGIKNVTCDYVIFLDADDVLKERALEKIENIIENKEFDICEYGIDLAYNKNYVFDKSIIENIFIKSKGKTKTNDYLYECFFSERIKINVWNKIYKTKILKEVLKYNIYSHIYLEEDWIISLITLDKCNKLIQINDKLVKYYVGGGISTTQTIKTKKQAIKRASAIKSLLIIKKYISDNLSDYQNPEILELIENRIWQFIFRDMYYNCNITNRIVYLEELLKYVDIYTILVNFSNILSINTFANPVDVINSMLECDYEKTEVYRFLTDLLAKYEYTSRKQTHNISQVDVNTIKEIFFKSTTWRIGSIFTYIPRKLKDQYLEKLASKAEIANNYFVPIHKKEGLFNFLAIKTILSKSGKIKNVDKLLKYEYTRNLKYLYFCDELGEDSSKIIQYSKENNYDLFIIMFRKNNYLNNKNNIDIPIATVGTTLDENIFSCLNIFDGIITKTNKTKEICSHIKSIEIRTIAITNLKINSPKVKCIKSIDEKNFSTYFNWLNNYDIDVSKDLISVVIPTYNAGSEIRQLLHSLKNQQNINEPEIIVVDSNSTDDTLAIASEFGAKIINISQKEFTHSKARNLGAKNASGNYVMFTVQDALPYNQLTLYKLLRKCKSHKKAAAISPSQEGREDCDLYYERMLDVYKYDYFNIFNSDVRTLPKVKNYYNMRTNASLDDVMCLFKKEVFDKFKFTVDYAEDCDISVRLLKNSYVLLKTKDTKVIHSHNRKAFYFLKRNIVDILHVIKIFPNIPFDYFDLDRLVNYIYLLYVWSKLFIKFINLNEYQFNNYRNMIINVNKICNRINYNLERISRKDYLSQIKYGNNNFEKEYIEIVRFIYKRIDFLRINNDELIIMTDHLKNELNNICYLLDDYSFSSKENKMKLINFLLRKVGELTGHALGSYYLKNKNIDPEVDSLVMQLKKGV